MNPSEPYGNLYKDYTGVVMGLYRGWDRALQGLYGDRSIQGE